EVSQDPILDTSADKHATYLATNLQNGNLTALSHDENPSFPGFFAATPLARADLAGAPATEWITEDVSADALQADAASTASNCVGGLFATVYHLQSMTGPQETVGVGIEQNSTTFTCVLDFGQTTGVFGTPVANQIRQGAGQQMPTTAIA